MQFEYITIIMVIAYEQLQHAVIIGRFNKKPKLQSGGAVVLHNHNKQIVAVDRLAATTRDTDTSTAATIVKRNNPVSNEYYRRTPYCVSRAKLPRYLSENVGKDVTQRHKHNTYQTFQNNTVLCMQGEYVTALLNGCLLRVHLPFPPRPRHLGHKAGSCLVK